MDRPKRKFFWVDELVKKTGEVAMEEARRHNTYIIYKRDDGSTVRAYPDGKIEVIKENEKKGEKDETNT